VATIISFSLSELGWRNYPKANFYLAPTRMWELLVGSLVAFYIYKHGVKANDVLSIVGFLAITTAIVTFDESTPFPSVYATIPVLGSVLLIIYAGNNTLVGKLLSTKILVKVGLFSYSAYLLHQPLFAFARIRFLGLPPAWVMGFLSFFSIIMSYLSWRYVEQPFRNKISNKTVGLISFAGIIFFVTTGLALYYYSLNTHKHRAESFSNWKDNSKCVIRDDFLFSRDEIKFKKNCLTKDNNFVLIGDSHAGSLSFKLREIIEESGGSIITLSATGCFPIRGTTRKPLQVSCVQNKEEYWKFIQSTNATIVFSSRWRLNLVGTRFNNGEGGVEYGESGINVVIENEKIDILKHTFQTLEKLSKTKKIIIISQIPEAGWNVPIRAAQIRKFTPSRKVEIATSYQVYKDENKDVIQLMDKLSSVPDITVLNVQDLVCDNQVKNKCINNINGNSLYRDDDHPSPLFADMIAKWFQNEVFRK